MDLYTISTHSGRGKAVSRPSTNTMNSPGIKIDKVSLQLQDHLVFDSLSLEFAEQQCHCVLGKSGVGKSSLLNILSGSAPIQAGSVEASNGLDLSNQIAHMFQDDGLLPWLSIVDNVQLGHRLRGDVTRDSTTRAMELLSTVGLTDWSKHYPRNLSGGMRQRVALARTLMEDRPIILMDEPFSRLDAITRDELQVLACELLNNRTVVLVTHDPAEALRIGDTVTVLHSGFPSSATTFTPTTQTPRAHDDAQVLKLTPALWTALSADSAMSREVG